MAGMRKRKQLLLESAGLFMLVSGAAAQSCKELKPADQFSLPAGQAAATFMGSSKPDEASKRHLAIPQGPLSSVRISLDRTQCYGSCPDYAIELNGNGSASFTGRLYVLAEGKHTFHIPEKSIQCLLSHFQQADFWSVNDEYVADATDGPQYRLTLTIDGQTKTVVDYFGLMAGMPGLITAIEDEVDRTADVDRWVKGTANTLPSLREEGFDFHSEAAAKLLVRAAAAAPLDLVEGLINAGAPVNGRVIWPMSGKRTAAIEQACRGGRLAVVQALIARGALDDGSQDTKDGALRAAAASGDPQVVEEMLKHGPNVNALDPYGGTALILAQQSMGRREDATRTDVVGVVRLLLAAGADPNIVNGSGESALFRCSNLDALRLLMKAGAKVNLRNSSGDTPLLSALSDDIAVALIEAGADTTVVSE